MNHSYALAGGATVYTQEVLEHPREVCVCQGERETWFFFLRLKTAVSMGS